MVKTIHSVHYHNLWSGHSPWLKVDVYMVKGKKCKEGRDGKRDGVGRRVRGGVGWGRQGLISESAPTVITGTIGHLSGVHTGSCQSGSGHVAFFSLSLSNLHWTSTCHSYREHFSRGHCHCSLSYLTSKHQHLIGYYSSLDSSKHPCLVSCVYWLSKLHSLFVN